MTTVETAPPTIGQPSEARSVLRLVVAYLAILPASSAHVIVFRVAFGSEPPSWIGFVNVAILGVCLVLAATLRPWRPLGGFFLALIALAAGELIATPAYAAFEHAGWLTRMFANTTIELIPCAFLAASALLTGLTRRDIFLQTGDMAAVSRLPLGARLSWRLLGPLLGVFLAAGLSIQLALTVRPDVGMLARVVAALPIAVAFAAINAAQEEFRFRAVLLARLLPSIGPTHAMLVTSLFFGLEHWFGHPSGPSGVLLAGFAGYVWAKSMVETKGLAWPWLIHMVQDVVIVSFLVAAR